MIHHTLPVRKKPIKPPVKYSRTDETVDVSDSEEVDPTRRDGSGVPAGYDDVVDEAGERRQAADYEGGDGAPVGAEFGGVAVDAVEPVHVWD